MPCDRSDDPEHSRRLLWHAAGNLDPAEEPAMVQHLAQCASCREEVAALASLGASLRTGAGHPGPQDRDLRGAASPLISKRVRRMAVAAGLAAIAVVSAALLWRGESDRITFELKDEATQGLMKPVAPAAEKRVKAGGKDKDAAEGDGLSPPTSSAIRDSSPPPADAVFLPAQRGDSGANILNGEGPWLVSVALPFDATDGPLRFQVMPAADGNAVAGPYTGTAQEGEARVSLDPLLPGRYILRVIPAAGASSYDYPFQVDGLASP